MLLKEIVRNNLLRYLSIEQLTNDDLNFIYETEMVKIKNFPVSEDVYDTNELMGLFEMLYELEYKYNIARKSLFRGNEIRERNINSIFFNKLNEIIDALVPTFIITINGWINQHDASNPDSMFDNWIDDMSGSESDMINIVIDSYAAQNYGIYNSNKKHQYWDEITNAIDNNIEQYPKVQKLLNDSGLLEITQDDMRYELESYGLEDFNDKYGTEFETKEEADQYITDYEEEYNFSDLYSEPESLFGLYNLEEILREIFKNQIIPPFLNRWGGSVETTLEDNQEIVEKLENVDRYPLSEKSAILNQAINSVHVTGNMMDYYENRFVISGYDLENLSNQDVSEWNKELKLLGFSLN